MPLIKDLAPNTFCWPELCSGDAAQSQKFYAALLSWTFEEMAGPHGSYYLCKLKGDPTAGMYQMKPERQAAGVRPHWNLYIAVHDVRATVEKVRQAGGKLHGDVIDMGGMVSANAEDNGGARFCLWQLSNPVSASRQAETNALTWCELYTPDTTKAAEFYNKVFGWEATPFPGPKEYFVFNVPGQSMGGGGMLQITPEMQGMPPQWLPYFRVEDCDKSAATITSGGGMVFVPPFDIAVGRIAIGADVQHAPLALIQMNCDTIAQTHGSGRQFTITREFDAPIELLWKCWTEPEHMARWWGPSMFTNPVCELDVRAGGKFRIVMRSPDGKEYPFGGTFTEVKEPSKLVMASVIDDHPDEWYDMVMPNRDKSVKPVVKALQTVTLVETDGKTRLTVLSEFDTAEIRENMQNMGMTEGWSQSFARLAGELDKLRQQG